MVVPVYTLHVTSIERREEAVILMSAADMPSRPVASAVLNADCTDESLNCAVVRSMVMVAVSITHDVHAVLLVEVESFELLETSSVSFTAILSHLHSGWRHKLTVLQV